jgi:hypothetical protein
MGLTEEKSNKESTIEEFKKNLTLIEKKLANDGIFNVEIVAKLF